MTHLLIGVLLFAVSLLAVLEAPNNLLWMLSVVVKELGWFFALLCLLLVWPGWIHSPVAGVGALLALTAFVIYLVPLVKGAGAARQAIEFFADVPPAPGDRPAPFRWRDLILGPRYRRVPVETFTYAVHDGHELGLDIYRPEPGTVAGPVPAVLVIHGGSWRSGDRKQLAALNHYLAGRGYVVGAMSYRLAPRWQFPHMMEDVAAAIRYVKEHADELGADPSRIVLLGRSAGAQLAVVAAYTADDPAIRGVISYYGPLDVEWGYPQHCRVLDTRTVLEQFLGGSPEQVPHLYRDASVTNLVGPNTPPLLMVQGSADTMVAPTHSHNVIEKLKVHGRPYIYVEVPLATHGSDANLGGPFGQIGIYAVERFLRKVTQQ